MFGRNMSVKNVADENFYGRSVIRKRHGKMNTDFMGLDIIEINQYFLKGKRPKFGIGHARWR